MKRVLSLVLALALVLGSIPAGFAADTQTAGEILKGYGVLSGDANGNLNETQTIDRATMYTVLIKLLGKDAEAKAYTVPSTFSDDDTNWAANYIAFAEKEGLTKGIGNGLFSPNGKVTLQQMATIMLRALGYEADYNTAIEDATAQGLLKGVVESDNAGIVVKSDVYTSMVNTLNAPVKGSTELLGNVLKIVGFNAGSELKVASITAGTAKSFLVKFNRAVAETDKVTFVVKKVTTEMKLTTTWNADKTEATLASTTNLPEATYAVSVLADAKEVSAKDVAITAQKLSKIEVISDKLSIVTATSGSTTKGYATYKAYDQYGNDITTTYLTNNIDWRTGVGTVDGATTKGVLILDPGTVNLLIYSTVVITGLDNTAGVSVTKSLATTTAIGTLSDFKFGDATNLKLVDGDTTSVFYIPYTALDMSGNETKNYELVNEGLYNINVSSSVVTAKVVKDPSNSKNAAIEVRVTGTQSNQIDLPVIITAMAYSGKVATVNTTLAKAKQLETFTLLSPVDNIAAGAKIEIPFEAYDQAGTKLTKSGDIKTKVSISQLAETPAPGSLYWDERVDSTAKLMFWAPDLESNEQTKTTYVTAMVTSSTSGKISSLNLTTQKPAMPDELQLDTSVLVTAMENGATQKIDFGYDEGGVVVLDQYGKDIDFYHEGTFTYQNPTTKAYATANNFKLMVATSDISEMALSKTTYTAGGDDIDGANAASVVIVPNTAQSVKMHAIPTNGGAATLTFTLFRDANDDSVVDTGEAVDTQTVSMSIVKTDDIKGYMVSPVTAPIYAGIESGGTLTAKVKEYAKKLKVYGTNASGAKVLLQGKPVMNVAVDNQDEFYAYTKSGATTENAYDKSYVLALKPVDKTKTSATTNASITIFHDGEVKTVTTAINSSTIAPKAVDVGFFVSDYAGATYDEDTNTVNIAKALFTGVIQEYQTNGNDGNGDAYFYITDSYGCEGMNFANFKITKHLDSSSAAVTTLSIDSKGALTGSVNVGDQVTISATTNNGLIKTIKFIIE